jgi:hypothetical protein
MVEHINPYKLSAEPIVIGATTQVLPETNAPVKKEKSESKSKTTTKKKK